MKFAKGSVCSRGTIVKVRDIRKNPLKVKTMLCAAKCPRSRYLLTVRDARGHYSQVYSAVVEDNSSNLYNYRAWLPILK